MLVVHVSQTRSIEKGRHTSFQEQDIPTAPRKCSIHFLKNRSEIASSAETVGGLESHGCLGDGDLVWKLGSERRKKWHFNNRGSLHHRLEITMWRTHYCQFKGIQLTSSKWKCNQSITKKGEFCTWGNSEPLQTRIRKTKRIDIEKEENVGQIFHWSKPLLNYFTLLNDLQKDFFQACLVDSPLDDAAILSVVPHFLE